MGSHSVSKSDWEQVQAAESESWGRGAWPCVKGKLNRETNNQRGLVRELGFDVYAATIPTDRDVYLLDIGAGPCSVLETITLPPNVQPVATDPLANEYHKFGLYEMEKYRTTYFTFPAETLHMVPRDFPYFDAVISTNALDHAQDPRKVCQEIKRVLRDGGLLFVQFCINNADENPHEAHKINLDDIVVRGWLEPEMTLVRKKFSEYSWSFQPSIAMVFKKS